MMFGETLRIPRWLRDGSPFEHLALVPAEDIWIVPVLVIAAVALALTAVGQAAFRRRDIG
jgi:ABC-2 type transport system permease protein